jgi:hypothetical protein
MRGDYSKKVRSRRDELLQKKRSGDDLSKYRECQRELGQLIGEIRSYLQADPFGDTAEEIAFYKEEAPWIWGQYFFYEKLVEIEAYRKFQSEDTFRVGLRGRLQDTEMFFQKHARICGYYYSGRTDADERLFTRRGAQNVDGAAVDMRIDRDFTKGALGVSRMRQHELLRDWLTRELEGPPEPGRIKKLEWHASATETIELFKALYLTGCFGDMTFKDVMEWVRRVLGVDPGNFDITLQNIRYRKGGTTMYLDLLAKAFKNFIDSKP